MADLSKEQYAWFCSFLESTSGIVLGPSKQYLVSSRLAPLVAKYGLSSVGELVDKAGSISARALRSELIDAMTTNETLWFRDGYPFNILRQRLLPEFAQTKKLGPVKIWSAASSSGQEPYSIAMTCLESSIPKFKTSGGVQIVATDISPTMLTLCKNGEYDRLSLNRGLSEERKRMFFEKANENSMRVKREVKSLVTFKYLNLLESYRGMGMFDVIFCRNVLIYFSAQVKAKIIDQMADCLNPGGYLFLGGSESLTGLSKRFDMQCCSPGIIYKLKS